MTAFETGSSVPLVSARNVAVEFPVQGGRRGAAVRAVDGVDFDIARGSVVGLVGESGCGKSTLGRALIGLNKLSQGTIAYDGKAVTGSGSRAERALRRRVQIVFQNPQASLNPRHTVGTSIAEPLSVHGRHSRSELTLRVAELLVEVGLQPDMARRYPHEFSGGQRQRIAIARALSADPEFIVCDEPISALDVSIQAQVLNLLAELRERKNLTYLFISHDLAVVRRICTDVAVMYLGRIIEYGPSEAIYANPTHPYTATLLSAAPLPDPVKERTRERILLSGDPPSPENPPPGCSFHTRCWLYQQLGAPESCRTLRPQLADTASGQKVTCHFPVEAASAAQSLINPHPVPEEGKPS